MTRAVALVVNESRPQAIALARQAAVWLGSNGVEVKLSKADGLTTGLDELGVADDDLRHGLDLVVALGGDGTTLRAVHLAAPQGAPVLGVGLGRLAYLSTIEPEDMCDSLARVLAGDYQIEERTMLTVTVDSGGGAQSAPITHHALNEAVLEHAGAGHTVHLAVSVAGRFFTSYVADALILATPTGSTAYSFSAGGPIVSPRHEALLATPVAAHTPFSRTLVLHRSEPVRAEVLDHRGATLSIDGQDLGPVEQGASVIGEIAPFAAKFVTFGERDFYGILKAKFGLADR